MAGTGRVGLSSAFGKSDLGFAFLVHAALAAAFLSPALATGGVLLPAELLHALYPWGAYMQGVSNHNKEITDAILVFRPFFDFFRESVLGGEWPLRNPHSGLGLPFAANAQSACYYPLTWLSLLGHTGWNLLLASRLVLAGVGTFLLARGLGRSRTAALAASIAYAYSLPFAAWLPGPLSNVNALLPFLLLAALAVARRPRRRNGAAFGLALLAMHLGGNPEYTLLNAGAAFAFGVAVAASSRRRAAVPAAAVLLAGGTAGTLAASIQLFPFVEYLLRSRGWAEHATRAPFLLEPWRAVTWVAPLFFGRHMDRSLWLEGRGFLEFGAFAGASVLALALTSTFACRARRVAPLLLLAVFFCGLAYGVPPVSWLRHVPPLDRTVIQRSLHIAALAVALLAAFGLDRLVALRRRGGLRLTLRTALAAPAGLLLAGIAVAGSFLANGVPAAALAATAGKSLTFAAAACVALVAAVASRFRPPLQLAWVAAVVTVDLWRAVFDFHGVVNRTLVAFPTQVTSFLRERGPESRVLPLRFVMPPQTNLPYGIASPLSFDALDSMDQAVFLRQLGGYAGRGLTSIVIPDALANPQVARLAALRYLFDEPQAPALDTPAFSERTGFRLRRVYDEPDGRIYELPDARPRVWFTASAVADPGHRRFRDALRRRDPTSSETVFVDASVAASPGSGEGSVTVADRRASSIRVRCRSTAPGWLFFSEGWFPGWSARVNDRRAPVVRANGPFFAVPVGAGESDVVVRYRPASFGIGALVSAFAAAALVVAAAIRPALPRGSPVSAG